MKLSATDIAFEGFRVVRDRPVSVLVWAALQLAGMMAAQPVLFSVLGIVDKANQISAAYFTSAMAHPTTPPMSEAQTAVLNQATAQAFPAVMIVLGLTLLVRAFVNPAIYRVAMTPAERGLFGLKLGLQEARQFLLLLIAVGLLFVFLVVATVGSLIVAAVFSVAGSEGVVLGLAVSFTATLCAAVYLATRLSFAGPLTFERNRLDVFGSWALTRGSSYGLIAGYGLTLVMAALVFLLSSLVGQALAVLVAGGADQAQKALTAPVVHLADLYTPLRLVGDAYDALVGALITAIVVGAQAAAFIQIRKQQPA